MYGNESPGGKFPALQAGLYKDDAGSYQGCLDIGPNSFALYPEYLTDPMITFCPSDPEMSDSVANAHFDQDPANEWCFNVAARNGGYCARAIDASYCYWGWVFDDLESSATDTAVDPILALAASYIAPEDMPEGAAGTMIPKQLYDGVFAILQVVITVLASTDPNVTNIASDQDLHLQPGAASGNGGSDTIYRLAEGVERYVIQDVTNSAATAMSQSEIFILYDQVSTDPAMFNHVPGGSNVLYMDGHVEFLKYPTKAPVNKPMAIVTGFFSSN
jgi:prepilin-type processing-associated H-X9-DG protein